MSGRQNMGSRPRDLREHNTKRIMSVLSVDHGQTVQEVSEKVSLSRTAVQNIFAVLEKSRIIIRGEKGSSTSAGGKRPELYYINPDAANCIFVYLNSNITMVELYDLSGQKKTEKQVYVAGKEFDKQKELIRDAVIDLVTEAGLDMNQIFGISIAVSGLIDRDRCTVLRYTGVFSDEAWREKLPVVSELKSMLHYDGVVILERLFTYAGVESFVNYARKPDASAFCIYAHEFGIGSSQIRRGKVDDGHSGLTGEVAHIRVMQNAKVRCRCGRTGCFESMIYPEAIHERMRNRGVSDAWLKENIHTISDVLLLSEQGNLDAQTELTWIANLFAQIIYNVQIHQDPDFVIFNCSFPVSCLRLQQEIEEKLRFLSKGQIEVPVNIVFDTTNFPELVRRGAVGYLRQVSLERAHISKSIPV